MHAASAPLGPIDLRLQSLVDTSVREAVQTFAPRQLRSDQLAVTLVDLTDPAKPAHASHRGDVAVYPASVIKLFYLVAVHQWLEEGKLEDTSELRRAMRDMIVESYNEATHYLIDLLTGTTSGPELPAAELTIWHEKRNAVNRYFASLGYAGINADKKPWCEGPYGRETQAIRAFEPKRNQLTTDATARLLVEIVTGKAVSPKRCAEMLELMRRDPWGTADQDPDSQSRFTGPALPKGSKLWSKAGWTSETRHDATIIELPNGRKVVLVMFTVDHASERGILPAIAKGILEGLMANGR
jgi:beta-lactamase class A